MLPNQDQVAGKWKEIKGELRKTWGEITDDEFEKTKGDMQAITGLIQQKYGESKENLKDKVSRIFSSFKQSRSNVTEDVKADLRH